MALKDFLRNINKQDTVVVGKLDLHLLSLDAKDNDRAKNVNAPSQVGNCARANYYARTGVEVDGSIDARSRRIFDNGTGVHERLQKYMKDAGILLMDEVPCICDEYTIQGHTDGILYDGSVLEIKSINSRGFQALKEPKPNHILQGHTYMLCLEERRKHLRNTYKSITHFKLSGNKRAEYYARHFQHFKSGSKYTREEKIKMQVSLGLECDKILYNMDKPVNRVVFLYENKDTQELKEFVVVMKAKVMKDIKSYFSYMDTCVRDGKLPEREGTCKSDDCCRWCNYKLECWG